MAVDSRQKRESASCKEEKMAKKVTIKQPSLVGNTEFTPTAAMIRFALAYAQQLDVAPTRILKNLGYSPALWTQWNAKQKFKTYLQQAVAEIMGTGGLAEVYRAIKREALKHSAQDRKLYLERFDSEYRPAKELALSATTAGRRPPDQEAIDASEAKRKAIDSRVIEQ
jgi:hypothetical protein